ncbi:SusC/RagA family TonB-linked outer membrane protein, partial [Gelidibacter japonicus]|uniref:SusC/RagA family TonB-linked outer membrane protein n=1 Tax=Gelidibacter japonicus TaxID=1962232 RepID=UPI001F07776B
MEIKLINVRSLIRKRLLLIIMRTFIFLLCTTVFSFNTENSLAQEKVTIDVDKVATIDEVFEIIIDQTKYRFLYPEGLFKNVPKVQLKKGTIRVDKLLNQSLDAGKFNVIVSKNNTIIIKDFFSQEPIQVVGKVVDEAGLPVSGATVLIKGTTIGVATDFDGSYSILVPNQENILVFSALGFLTQEIIVGSQTQVNVVFRENISKLDEVTINAGYYKTSQRETTGSISKVVAKTIEKQPVINPLATLQGRMTGVNIIQTTGVPGSGFDIKIRGQNSIRSDGNDPLYIIDGVPYASNTLQDPNISFYILNGFKGSNVLNSINPSDIESIEILKDADATSIYGSRGANGVVLITTKKGYIGKTKFDLNISNGFGTITRKLDLLDTEQYLEMRDEAFENDGIDYAFSDYDINGTWDRNRYTDWQEFFVGGTAKITNYQAAVSGGNETTQFLLSGNFQSQTTVFPGDFKYSRGSVLLNISNRSKNDNFTMRFSANYSNDKNDLPQTDFLGSVYIAPNAPEIYDENGEINWEDGTFINPMANINATYLAKTNTLFSNLSFGYKIMPNLEFKTNLGYNITFFNEKNITPNTIYNPAYGLGSEYSSTTVNNSHRHSYIMEPQLEWKKSFKESELTFLGGLTFQKQVSENLVQSGYGFTSNSLIEDLASAADVYVLNNSKTEYVYNAAFARVNYNLQSKYIINLTGRRDGSSRFGPKRRFSNFGAVGMAWIFSEENFLGNSNILSFGKIRTSFGITGNDQIGDYQYLDTYASSGLYYEGIPTLAPTRLYNPDFSWEENKKFEISLEIGLFNDRILLNTNYYNNRSSNQLIGIPLPTTTGFSTLTANFDATVQNTGLEIEMNAKNVSTPNFSWNTSMNITFPKNELVEFPGLEESTFANQLVIGEPLGILKLYNNLGVNPETGIYEFEDVNNDGIINTSDRQYIQNLNPKFFGGINNNFQFKNFEFDIFFQFVKQTGYNYQFTNGLPGTNYNQPTD